MTHIFIVDETTFNVHLKYQFAGTGYTDGDGNPKTIDLNSSSNGSDSTEKTLVGMIADISRIRTGDHVLFHVTGSKRIFGIFEIVGTPFHNLLIDDYKGDKLEKYLSFRIQIKPYKVYLKGISETQALNDISNIKHPYEMFWSLIYRKLTGNRGCSYLTDPEANRMESLLNVINLNKFYNKGNFQYNSNTKEIELSQEKFTYSGNTSIPLTIDTRLFAINKCAFEGHLQAYITQNFDKGDLKNLLLPNNSLKTWIANEVYCSVGEQRIDVLIINVTQNEVIIRIIELKDESPKAVIITEQIPWYINWIDQYIAPNYSHLKKKIKIIPTIIAVPYKRNCPNKSLFEFIYNETNKIEFTKLKNSVKCKTELIYIIKDEGSINFQKV